MGKRLTKVLHLLNLVFTIMCLCHVSFTLYNAVNPPRPEIKVYDKALKDVPFPILFKFCGKEIHNTSRRFIEYGYEDEFSFFAGISQFSRNIVGWKGHTENGSMLSTVQGITIHNKQKVKCKILNVFLEILGKVSFDWNNIIDKIKVYYIGTNSYKKLNGSDLVLSTVPSYPNCKTLDIFDYFSIIPVPTQVFIYLKRTENLGVDLYLLDKNFASKRSVKSELSAYIGPRLTNPDLINTKKERLILKITQTKDAAEDE